MPGNADNVSQDVNVANVPNVTNEADPPLDVATESLEAPETLGQAEPVQKVDTLEALEKLEERAKQYFHQARAENTVKAYNHDLEDFAVWCKVDMGGRGFSPASPETVALYITDLAGRGLKAATIGRRLSAIGQLHQEAELEDPTKAKRVKNTYKGVLREIGSYQEGKAPILTPTVRRILAGFADEKGPAAVRDRALLLLGLAGGYRVGELAALRAEDIQLRDEGAVLLLRRSKTDQAGGGFYKGIPYGTHAETCPVAHLGEWIALIPDLQDKPYEQHEPHEAWKAHEAKKEGPLFRGVDRHGNIADKPMAPDSISRVVKKRARAAKLDPGRYSGHSLRAGFVTAASDGGAHDADIMRQTAHRSLSTLHRYRRTIGLFDNNPASVLGL
ncbi:site-specific integrase [soil metagenome]